MPRFTSDEDYEEAFGLPRPRWDRIRSRVTSEAEPTKKHELWCEAQREWLGRLCGALPQTYQVAESEHFMVVTAARGGGSWVTDFAEQARERIAGLLGERPGDTIGKTAVLIFAGTGDYYRYLRHYSPDGKPRLSAGVWINDGDAHVAIDGLVGFKTVLVHELVHAHLASPPRPRWLEEGLAHHVERRLVTRERLPNGTALRQELRAYWRSRTLTDFWNGDGFNDARPHGARPYAYELADLLVFELAALSEADLRRFSLAARRGDAGAAAAREVYGFGLEVWVRKVLGEGEWAPN